MVALPPSSCFLFHGPGAKQAALSHIQNIGGWMMAPPIGEEGLKVADAREVTELLLSPPVGDCALGVVLIGPVDRATPDALDALLKPIEEFGAATIPVLWAHDLEDVWETIRSRCMDQWAPADLLIEDEDSSQALAWDVLEVVLSGNLAVLTRLTGKRAKEEKVDVVIQAMITSLASDIQQPVRRKMWDSLRKLTQQRRPTRAGLIAALLEGVQA